MSQILQICGSHLSRPKNENKKNEKITECGQRKKFSLEGDLVRGSNKVSFIAQDLPLPVFYCLQTADMEGLRKVFNVLEIENNDPERILKEDPERRCVHQFDCNHEHHGRCSETVWKHSDFEVIGKFNVYSWYHKRKSE